MENVGTSFRNSLSSRASSEWYRGGNKALLITLPPPHSHNTSLSDAFCHAQGTTVRDGSGTWYHNLFSGAEGRQTQVLHNEVSYPSWSRKIISCTIFAQSQPRNKSHCGGLCWRCQSNMGDFRIHLKSGLVSIVCLSSWERSRWIRSLQTCPYFHFMVCRIIILSLSLFLLIVFLLLKVSRYRQD